MIAEVKKYPAHYLALAAILVCGVAAILIFRFEKLLLNIAIYSLGTLYVLWGILHHHSTNQLRAKVVLEYFLVAILGVIIIKTLV